MLALDDMQYFFPLKLDSCESWKAAHALVAWTTDTDAASRSDKSKIFETLLEIHHPELLSLVRMHVHLFPETNEQCTHAKLLAPGIDILLGRCQKEEAPDIQSSVFEDPCAGEW